MIARILSGSLGAALFVLAASAARAEDGRAGAIACGEARSRAEKVICGDPGLRSADKAMSVAYFDLLKRAQAADFKAALQMSQQRWLKEREAEFSATGGEAKPDAAADRTKMRKIIRDRTDALSRRGDGRDAPPAMLAVLLRQKADATTITGGPFAGFETSCMFLPEGFGDGAYLCLTKQRLQNADRVCSIETDWASGHTTETRTVSRIVDGRLKPTATCSIGYGSTDFQCASDDDAKTVWNFDPKPEQGSSVGSGPSVGLDPDVAGDSPASTPWLKACLEDPAYPARPKTP